MSEQPIAVFRVGEKEPRIQAGKRPEVVSEVLEHPGPAMRAEALKVGLFNVEPLRGERGQPDA